jgi:hypothetical protein
VSYLAGHPYADEWNAGPFGPAFGQKSDVAWQWASRTGDRIDVDLPLYGDRAGHAGLLVPTDRSRTALYRDGELVDEFPDSGSGSFAVPAENADYRLEVADRRSKGDLTTTLSAAWTFRSGQRWIQARVANPVNTSHSADSRKRAEALLQHRGG